MNAVVIYTTRWCPFCVRAKALLDQKGVSYQEIPVDGEPVARQQMAERAGQTSVPQIWIGENILVVVTSFMVSSALAG